jgi:hypothetical protein
MGTTVHKMSIDQLRFLINKGREIKAEHQRKLKIEEQERKEYENQLITKRKENERIEEQKRLEAERKKNFSASKKNIDLLTDKVSRLYSNVCSIKNKNIRTEEALRQKREDYDTFLAAMDEAYPVRDFDEKETAKMRNKRWAYYGLPLADIVFAYLALLPITQSKLISGFPEVIKDIMPIIGAALATIIGLLVTLFGRWGKSSSDDVKWFKSPLLIVTSLIVPAIYWVHFFVYSDKSGTDTAFALIFSVISFIIQIWIIEAYSKQIEACAYFNEMKNNESTRESRDKQNFELNSEIQKLKAESDRQLPDFQNIFFNEFGTAFRELALAREKHINEHKEEPIILLDWKLTFVGNTMFFQRTQIPMPEIKGSEIVTISDIEAIENMLHRIGWEVEFVKCLKRNFPLLYDEENKSNEQLPEAQLPILPEIIEPDGSGEPDGPDGLGLKDDIQTPSPDDGLISKDGVDYDDDDEVPNESLW